jgi:uncharacterized protein YxjI
MMTLTARDIWRTPSELPEFTWQLPPQLLYLAPVCLFGFALCPYLDLTFHRARQHTTSPRAAFGVGFALLFLAMILFTVLYSKAINGRMSRFLGYVLFIHMAVQCAFTLALHGLLWPGISRVCVALHAAGAPIDAGSADDLHPGAFARASDVLARLRGGADDLACPRPGDRALIQYPRLSNRPPPARGDNPIMRYVMKQKVFSFGDDFVIRDEAGTDRFLVDGRAFSIGDKLSLQDMSRQELAYIKQKLLSWGPTYEIWYGDSLAAVVKKKLFTFLRCKFSVDVPGPDDLEAAGNFLDHEYQFTRGGSVVATVSKRWFTWADTYGVDVAPSEDDVLVLASTVVIDLCCHDDDRRH